MMTPKKKTVDTSPKTSGTSSQGASSSKKRAQQISTAAWMLDIFTASTM